MLYTLITFVALFIIVTVAAIIFYVKFEKQRDIARTAESDLEQMVSPAEQRKGLGKIVGAIPRGKSALGAMVDYLDQMVSLTIGGLPQDDSAEVKADKANRNVKETLQRLAQTYPQLAVDDPNTAGLIPTLKTIKTQLDNTVNSLLSTEQQLEELQNQFDDAKQVNFQKEKILLAEKEKYQQQVNQIKKDYNDLEILLEQTTEQQVKTLRTQLDQTKADQRQLKQQLLKTQAELTMAREKMELTLEELRKLEPLPQVAAFRPDGKIILIDNRAKIVHLNIGSADRVYPGLTFTVYAKNAPILKDSRGKAEVEVFDIGKNISTARVVSAKGKYPIVTNDVVANLIWDTDKANTFVVAGDFDIDSDGYLDYDGIDKINRLIKGWGGRIGNIISVDTDYLILGKPPQLLPKPTFEDLAVDPMAMEKYEASLQRLNRYKETQSQAQTLSVPVFNYERFLYLIGYKTLAARTWPF